VVTSARSGDAAGLAIEDVRDHLDEIRDEAGYTVPNGAADEMTALFTTVMSD